MSKLKGRKSPAVIFLLRVTPAINGGGNNA